MSFTTSKKRNIRRPQQFEVSKVEGYFMISKQDALEEYCRERFNYSRDIIAYLKISAATVYDNI